MRSTSTLAVVVIALIAVLGLAFPFLGAQDASGQRLVPPTLLSPSLERGQCKLQLTGDWRSALCESMSDEQSDAFNVCYEKCLTFGTRLISRRERSTSIDISNLLAKRCAALCFDSNV